jgi:hypothetical protein
MSVADWFPRWGRDRQGANCHQSRERCDGRLGDHPFPFGLFLLRAPLSSLWCRALSGFIGTVLTVSPGSSGGGGQWGAAATRRRHWDGSGMMGARKRVGVASCCRQGEAAVGEPQQQAKGGSGPKDRSSKAPWALGRAGPLGPLLWLFSPLGGLSRSRMLLCHQSNRCIDSKLLAPPFSPEARVPATCLCLFEPPDHERQRPRVEVWPGEAMMIRDRRRKTEGGWRKS